MYTVWYFVYSGVVNAVKSRGVQQFLSSLTHEEISSMCALLSSLPSPMSTISTNNNQEIKDINTASNTGNPTASALNTENVSSSINDNHYTSQSTYFKKILYVFV